MTNFAEMGKVELRAACKEAGIPYGKLNNDGMRAALAKATLSLQSKDEARATREAAYVEMAKKMDLSALGTDGIEGHCPCCGIDLSNGVATYADVCETNKKYAGEMVSEVTCLGCGGEWGPKIERTKQTDRHTGKGISIEKVREERNGVKRPSAGGKCRAVWDALDALQAELEAGEKVTSAMVKDLAADEGWNPNNASIEFYQWRKFNGIGKGSK